MFCVASWYASLFLRNYLFPLMGRIGGRVIPLWPHESTGESWATFKLFPGSLILEQVTLGWWKPSEAPFASLAAWQVARWQQWWPLGRWLALGVTVLPASSFGGPLVCPLILAGPHNWSSSFSHPRLVSTPLPHGCPMSSLLLCSRWAGLFSLLETRGN